MDVVDRAVRMARELHALIREADRRVDDAIKDLRQASRIERHDGERRAERLERDARRDLEGRGRGRDWDDRGRRDWDDRDDWGWREGREGDWDDSWPRERRYRWWRDQHAHAYREAAELQRLVAQLQRPGRRPEEFREQAYYLHDRFGRYRDHLRVMRRQCEPMYHGELDGLIRYADGWYNNWGDWRTMPYEQVMPHFQRMHHEMQSGYNTLTGMGRRLDGYGY